MQRETRTTPGVLTLRSTRTRACEIPLYKWWGVPPREEQPATAIAPVGLIADRRMTRGDLAALEYRTLEILARARPQSVRQIYYQALDPNGAAFVRKGDPGYNRVQRRVLAMRRDGKIGWQHIVDGTRETSHHSAAFDSPAEFIATYGPYFRVPVWHGQRIEIWCESRGFEGSIQPLADHWRVNTVAFGGQPSDSLLYECAARIERNERRGAPTTIFYCGDLDPSGLVIEEAPRRKLRTQWGVAPDWARILVTPDQVASYNLPSDEKGAVQAEAFPLAEARALLESALAAFLDPAELARAEAEERRMVAAMMEAVRGL